MLIREATSHEDLDEVTKIQREVWNAYGHIGSK